jgi:hypothetical protein
MERKMLEFCKEGKDQAAGGSKEFERSVAGWSPVIDTEAWGMDAESSTVSFSYS